MKITNTQQLVIILIFFIIFALEVIYICHIGAAGNTIYCYTVLHNSIFSGFLLVA